MPRMSCPHCGITLNIPFGSPENAKCPGCKQSFVIPPWLARPPKPPPIIVPKKETKLKESSGLIGLLDFEFKEYLTPWIVRISWIITLCWAALCITVLVIGGIFSMIPTASSPTKPGERYSRVEFDQSAIDEALDPKNYERWDYDPETSVEASRTETRAPNAAIDIDAWVNRVVARLLGVVTGVFGISMVVLWMRVLLEMVIVLFNIARTLTSIESTATIWRRTKS